MSNAITDAIRNGGNQVIMVSVSDLMAILEIAFKQAREDAQSENLADKDQLRPLNWWCEKMGINRSTFWRWEQEGIIKPTRLGNRLYLRQSDIDNMDKQKARVTL